MDFFPSKFVLTKRTISNVSITSNGPRDCMVFMISSQQSCEKVCLFAESQHVLIVKIFISANR